MNRIYIVFTLAILLLTSISLHAQQDKKVRKARKAYISSMAEGSILSTAMLDINNSSKLATMRYSAFFHTGLQVHKDLSKSFGVFTGLGIKNIGFINKVNDSTVKRRVYTVGVPIGLKFGLMKKSFVMLGGGVDIPFNYKEKGFVKRGKKDKFNEWFSNRTPSFLPYAFIGARTKQGFQIKLQYYPTNFFNQDYKENGVAIYQNYDAKLLMLTFGADIGGGKKKKKKKMPMFKKPSTTKTL